MTYLADVRISESLGAGAHVVFEASHTRFLSTGWDYELEITSGHLANHVLSKRVTIMEGSEDKSAIVYR